MARRLLDLRIHEVSLVDMPANKRRFAIIKHQKDKKMDKLTKLIEAFLGEELDKEVVSKAKLDPEVQKMLEDQLTVIEKYRADLPVAVAVAIGTLSQHAAFGITKSDDSDDDKDGDTDTDDDSDDKVTVESVIDGAVEKAAAKFSEDTQKALDSMSAKFEEFDKAIAAMKESIEKVSTQKDTDDGDEEIDEETLQKMINARVSKLEGK